MTWRSPDIDFLHKLSKICLILLALTDLLRRLKDSVNIEVKAAVSLSEQLIVLSDTTASTNFSDSLRPLAETHGPVDSVDFGVCADNSICFRTEDASPSARIDVGVVFVLNHDQQQNEIYLQLRIHFSSDLVSI